MTYEELLDRLSKVAEHYRNGLLTAKDVRDCNDLIMAEYLSQYYLQSR